MAAASPLRYPGGKQILSGVLSRLISLNSFEGKSYAEPYAGGAGAALSLLFSGFTKRLILNDADSCIHAMWHSVLTETERFLSLLSDTPLSISEWRRQKAIYSAPALHELLEVGFATFYLNRTNRSGIIKNAGPIGGHDQSGTWKIDARYNRLELRRRVEKIALYASRITFSNLDALSFLGGIQNPQATFVYLDPPYFAKGGELYLNYYRSSDHAKLETYLASQKTLTWIMSYDNVREIKELYSSFRQIEFELPYSATTRKTGQELLILGPGLQFPSEWSPTLPYEALKQAS